MTTSERRSRPRGEQTRATLLRAAMVVMERDGVPALTTRRVAQEADLPLGAVHYWFASKEELLAVVVGELLAEIRDALATLETRQVDSLADVLVRALQVMQSLPVGRQMAVFEVTTAALRSEALRPVARDQYAAYRSITGEAIEPLRERIEQRIPGGVAALATLLVAVMDGLTLAQLADPDVEAESAMRALGALLSASLADGAG